MSNLPSFPPLRLDYLSADTNTHLTLSLLLEVTVCFHLYRYGYFLRSSQCRIQFKIRGLKERGWLLLPVIMSNSRQFSIYLLSRKYLWFGYLHQPVSKTMGLLPLHNFSFFFFLTISFETIFFIFAESDMQADLFPSCAFQMPVNIRSRHLTNIKVNNYRHSGDTPVSVLRVWSRQVSRHVVCKTCSFRAVFCTIKIIVLMQYTLIGKQAQ